MSARPALDCATLNAMIAASPGNAWLGLRALHIDERELTLQLPWREDLRAVRGAATADDGALMCALNAACGYLIANLRCDRLDAAAAGDLLIVARLLKLGRTLSSVEAELRDGDGRLCVLARCSYFMAQAQHP
jgi:acyl-coenzyme A thioesterase PaaI-like protein